jgi:hypothetical protein
MRPGSVADLEAIRELAEFVREEWWPRYAVPNLKPSTQRRYLEVWGTHLLPALGDDELRAITPMLVEDLRAQFDAQRVGIQTQRKAPMLLQGILRRAVVRGLIPVNPVSVVTSLGSRPRAAPSHWRRRPALGGPESDRGRRPGRAQRRDARQALTPVCWRSSRTSYVHPLLRPSGPLGPN